MYWYCNIINKYPGTPLQQGSKGPSVTELQWMLNDIYFEPGIHEHLYPCKPLLLKADGQFGSATKNAVMKFQEECKCSLNANGVVESDTWDALVWNRDKAIKAWREYNQHRESDQPYIVLPSGTQEGQF